MHIQQIQIRCSNRRVPTISHEKDGYADAYHDVDDIFSLTLGFYVSGVDHKDQQKKTDLPLLNDATKSRYL